MSEDGLDEWKYGLCGCCSHGGKECAKMCCCMLCVYVRALEIVGIITRERCCLCFWCFPFCCCCNRGRIRRRYLIRGKPGLDFACAYCCCFLDCCRVILEVQNREDRYITWCYGVKEGFFATMEAEAAPPGAKVQPSVETDPNQHQDTSSVGDPEVGQTQSGDYNGETHDASTDMSR
mmetsp:Transcript_46790/g.69222  ORF Transcript_46790/g.69222 Transcript_46790/m.69222 type:complete len:177 (-) Transcript_46790:67-597(-)